MMILEIFCAAMLKMCVNHLNFRIVGTALQVFAVAVIKFSIFCLLKNSLSEDSMFQSLLNHMKTLAFY